MKIEIPANGIQFQCQGSGKCCVSHGEYGHVYMSLTDRRVMAKELKLSTSAFTKQYCMKKDGHWTLKDNPAGPECLFLKDKKCGVYHGRPTQCRTWPFWPEVMNPKSWQKDVVKFCPGVGKGRIFTPAEILSTLQTQADNEKSMFKAQYSLRRRETSGAGNDEIGI